MLDAPLSALVSSVIALIRVSPDPIAFQLGPLPVAWYGIAYAVGLTLSYLVITREARRRGLDARLVDNGIIVVAVAALIGGRLYHVIDQWERYQDDLLAIVLPPYSGLGVYGGILAGLVAVILYTRWLRQPFWRWADVIAPGLFVMQAVGRWGNFFNQELYGPPTDVPWAITIDCEHRVAAYSCAQYPFETTGFHPLFLYESISGILGAVTLLWLARRAGRWLRPGDLVLVFFIWYGVVRFAVETLRIGNWTVAGVPTATIVSTVVVLAAAGVLLWRHRSGAGRPDEWTDGVPAGGAPPDGRAGAGAAAGGWDAGSEDDKGTDGPEQGGEPREPVESGRGG
jgi:phosphatidylglycerol---prolipoprotein diacylglyceryl transferase